MTLYDIGLDWIGLDCTVLYYIIYCIVLYCIMLYYIVLCEFVCIQLYSIVLYRTLDNESKFHVITSLTKLFLNQSGIQKLRKEKGTESACLGGGGGGGVCSPKDGFSVFFL